MIRSALYGAAKQFLNVRILYKPNLLGPLKVATEQLHSQACRFSYFNVSEICRTGAAQKFTPNFLQPQVRTVTKFSIRKGKRKSVKAVLKRFFRLSWGIWIRTKAGRHKRLWKKTSNRKRRLRQHVFCNATQSKLLDKMTTKFWHRRKYYVDDPYEPYHSREEFEVTRKKPKFYYE